MTKQSSSFLLYNVQSLLSSPKDLAKAAKDAA